MLTPLHLRLCGFPAMAPALTEAASQAQNFKLPYTSPATAESARISHLNELNGERDFQDVKKKGGAGGVDFDAVPAEHVVRLVPRKRLVFRCNNKNKDSLTTLARREALNFATSVLDVYEPRDGDVITDSHLIKFGAAADFCFPSEPKKIKPALRSGAGGADCGQSYMMNSGGSEINNSFVVDTMGMLKTTNNIKFENNNKVIDISDRQLLSTVHHPSFQPTTRSRSASGGGSGVSGKESVMSTSTENNNSRPTDTSNVAENDGGGGDANKLLMDKDTLHKNRLHESCNRQVNLERRSECLLRRIQKLQARQMEKHVNNQLATLVEHQQKTLQLPSRRERLQQGLRTVIANSGGNVNNSDLKSEILQCEDVKNLSTAALVNLVRKLESTHGSPHRQKYVTLQHLRTVDKVENAVSAVKIPENVCVEMNRVASTLLSNVRHLEKAIDSDATESSSGGESCDELEGYDEKKSHSIPINKRAAWKWAVDRSAVASRWTWLQAQVSDLEYRIRQQNDAYRQIRATKGAVILEPPPQPTPALVDVSATSSHLTNAKDTTNVNPFPAAPSRLGGSVNDGSKISTNLSSLLSTADAKSLSAAVGTSSAAVNNTRHPAQVNGFVGSTSINSCKIDSTSALPLESKTIANGDIDASVDQLCATNDATCTSSRTRALKSFRKRKLLHSTGLYQLSHKAAKLSTVRCGCLPPAVPCTMCGGRINNIMNVEPDSMPMEERVALLDPSFHPVLSFDQDILMHMHFEALIKGGDWHRAAQKPKCASAARKKGRLAGGNTNDVHKQTRKLKKNATATLTAKLKKKLTENKRPRGRGSSLTMNKVGRNERICMKKQRERNMSGSSGSSSKPASPVPSLGDNSLGSNADHRDHPRKSSMLQDLIRRRRGESAFDINNIVIPYSMAAATRVERLQYKEILTPKWRLAEEVDKEDCPAVLPKDNGLIACKTEDEPVEDLTDEIFDTRHEKCEREEKKRFMGFAPQTSSHHPPSQQHHTLSGRGRPRNTRSDSRADSSGANTPDPMSPFPIDHHESPMTTPPSTPAPVVVDDSAYNSRRRTTSLSKRDRSLDEFRTASPEIDEDPVPPWDKRTFPLTDAEYDDILKSSSQTPPPSPSPTRRPSVEDPPTASTSSTPTLETAASSSTTTNATKPTTAATETNAINVKGLPSPLEATVATAIPPTTVQHTGEVNTAQMEPRSRPTTPLSTSSTSLLGDDPNDPEWTVSPISGEKGPRPGIVIKLAKR